jgi:hypothetical protein
VPSTNYIEGDTHFNRSLSCRTFVPPDGCIDDDAIEAAANVAYTKHQHMLDWNYYQVAGGAIVAASPELFIARAVGGLISIEAAITGTIATGADRTVTIDLHKSTGAAAFATVLSGTIVLDNTSVLRTLEAGTISDDDFVDGDLYRLVVTVAGAAGNQALGLIVTVHGWQKPL